MRHRFCGGCQKVKPVNPSHPQICKDCWYSLPRARRKRMRGKQRNKPAYAKHGLTLQQYQSLREEQRGLCAVCRKPRKLEIDHDHACCNRGHSCGLCVRGLVCQPCNGYIYQYESGKQDWYYFTARGVLRGVRQYLGVYQPW